MQSTTKRSATTPHQCVILPGNKKARPQRQTLSTHSWHKHMQSRLLRLQPGCSLMPTLKTSGLRATPQQAVVSNRRLSATNVTSQPHGHAYGLQHEPRPLASNRMRTPSWQPVTVRTPHFAGIRNKTRGVGCLDAACQRQQLAWQLVLISTWPHLQGEQLSDTAIGANQRLLSLTTETHQASAAPLKRHWGC